MEGYDAKFDPPLDKRLECPICLLAQREPMQTPCGHRFCSYCILRALRETSPRCPVDNTKVSHQSLFKDNFAKREVLSLTVHCHADDRGCVWKGELRQLEDHIKHCELVTVECPYDCSVSCQRKELQPHLTKCPNRPTVCPYCNINFPRNKLSHHNQHCSHILLPATLQDTVFKNNEILKWTGTLKIKLNLHNQPIQVTGFLTVKAETEESYLYTGGWFSSLNLIPLTNAYAKMFWKIIRGPEVRSNSLYFGIISTDPKSVLFQKMLRKKCENMNAAVGLWLKQCNNRDSTLIYFYWNDQKKRLMACVAELRSYIVKQMHNRLQNLQPSSRRSRSNPPPADPHMVELHEPAAHFRQPPNPTLSFQHPPHPSNNFAYPQHAAAAAAAVQVMNHPLSQSQPMQSSHSPQPGVVQSIFSWQISQNLPWRMQAAGPGVPFFTIPATPPQFLSAHSYPYTFAPLPAAPFIQPGTIPVPHVAALDPSVSTQNYPGTFAAAPIAAATIVPPLATSLPEGGSAFNTPRVPASHNAVISVIHQPVHHQQQIPHHSRDRESEESSVNLDDLSFVVPTPIHPLAVDRYAVPSSSYSHQSIQDPVATLHISNRDLEESSNPSSPANSFSSSESSSPLHLWENPAFSSSAQHSQLSADFSSPSSFGRFPLFSPSDSEVPSTPSSIDSPDAVLVSSRDSPISLSSSSQSGPDSLDGMPASDPSALHTLASAAALLARGASSNAASHEHSTDSPAPLRLPVLINVQSSTSEASGPPSVVHNSNSVQVSPIPPPSVMARSTRASSQEMLPAIVVPVIHHVTSANSGILQQSGLTAAPMQTLHYPETMHHINSGADHQGYYQQQQTPSRVIVAISESSHLPATMVPTPPTSRNRGLHLVNWPVEGGNDGLMQRHGQPNMQQPAAGNFWDTVIPSLDLSLQNAAGGASHN